MIFLVLFFNIDVSAESVLNGYSLSLTDITDQRILDEIKMLKIEPCDDKWCLYINNIMVKKFEGEEVVYDHQSIDKTLIKIRVSLTSNQVTFTYNNISNFNFMTLLKLSNIEDNIYLDIFFDLDKAEHVRLLGTKNENGYNFNNLSHQYIYHKDGQTHYFPIELQFYLNSDNNILSVKHNEDISTYTVEPNISVQSFFLETFVENHPLDIDYLRKDLPMKSFQLAKTELYDHSLIDKAVENEKLVLKHEESGLTHVVDLKQFLTFWRRVSEGEYDTSSTETIQVVCQWPEDICENVRNDYQDQGRLYAVFGSSFAYEDVKNEQIVELVHKYLELYKNIQWPEDSWSLGKDNVDDPYVYVQMRVNEATWQNWSLYTTIDSREDCEDDFNCTYQTRTMYKKQSMSWDAWSSYSNQYPSDCNDSYDCQWESIRFYNKRVAYWSAYSSYTTGYPSSCNDSVDCRWRSLRYYRYRTYSYIGTYSGFKSTCSITNDHHCSRYYKYTCQKGVSTSTRYSTLNYTIFTQGPCGSGYRITNKQSGYRYQYIKWGAWSGYSTNTCSNITGYKNCESQLRYSTSQKVWSSWTGYNQTSCYGNDLTQCLGPTTFYRIRNRSYGNWSEYVYESCLSDEDTNCVGQTQYAYRYRSWSGYSDWLDYDASVSENDNRMIYYRTNKGSVSWDEEPGDSQSIGQGIMYQNESKTIDQGLQYEEIEVAELLDKSLNTLTDMNENAIMNLANEIALATSRQLTLKKLMRLNERVLYDEVLEASLSDFLTEGQDMKRTFLATEIFIPYVYIRDHYRAIKKEMSVTDYDQEFQLSSTKNEIDTVTSLAPLIQQWKLFKDNKVVFYDPNDPLHDYEILPENWRAHSSLLAALADLKIDGNMISISLTKTDIKDIEEYLNDNNYQVSSCDILVRFSYLISDETGGFEQWLNDYKGVCNNVDSD